RPLQPVSPALMAEWSPHLGGKAPADDDTADDTDPARDDTDPARDDAAPAAGDTPRAQTTPSVDDTARVRTAPGEDTARSGSAAGPGSRLRDVVPSPAAPAPLKPPVTGETGEVFRFLENNLMEAEFSGKLFIKQGTIYSYGGNLTFWVKDRRPGGHPALVIITGTGKVILTDKEREVTLMQVHDETVFIEPTHLLACEESLTPRYVPLGDGANGLEILALEGRGMVALSVASKPLALPVTPDLPVSVPASSVITWSGGVTPRVIDDQQLYAVMAASGARKGPLIRLEGTGRVLVEQAAS